MQTEGLNLREEPSVSLLSLQGKEGEKEEQKGVQREYEGES